MGTETLMLSQTDVRDLLDMESCIQLQELAFTWYGEEVAHNSTNAWLLLPAYQGWMKLMSGVVQPKDRLAAKVTARFPNLPQGQNLGGVIVLYDANNGSVLSVMDAVYISAIRTGAGCGLAAKYLAREDSRVLGILGTGVQAQFNLAAFRLTVPSLEKVLVYSRSEANRNTFKRDMEQKVGLPVYPMTDPDEVIERADVLITATNSPNPVLFARQLRPGMHINVVGYKKEVDPEIFRSAKIVVDSRALAPEDGKIAAAIKQDIVRAEDIHAEISEIVLGAREGRVNQDEITIFDSSGLAVQDCVVADYVYQRALNEGKGVSVDLRISDNATPGSLYQEKVHNEYFV